jgi:hypothetical protein
MSHQKRAGTSEINRPKFGERAGLQGTKLLTLLFAGTDTNMADVVAREVRRVQRGLPPTIQLNQPLHPGCG